MDVVRHDDEPVEKIPFAVEVTQRFRNADGG
jgi:hypothetical protein